MKKSEKKRNRNRYKFVMGIMTVCIIFGSLSACKKDKGKEDDEIRTTPVAENVWEGFAEANKELVNQRAKEFAETTVVSVGDEKISLLRAMFLIYSMEIQGNSYAEYYESQYGMDYWGMTYDDEGRTMRDVYKEETLDALIQYAVLYDCATKNGMELTEEEVKENNAFVEEIKATLSAEETERGGFTTENLRESSGWMMLGEKYYGMMTENLGVSKESIRETINREDYKEYETEYIYLPTTYYDEEYNVCTESDEVIAERKAQMQSYYERVVAGATFDELVAEDESLVYNTRTFLENGEGAEEAYKHASMDLKVGEVCAPVQTEYGVYLIHMLDDECTKTYEATVDAEYELQRNEAFRAAYEVLLSGYEVTVNEEVWGEILLGATVSIRE